MSRYGYGYPRYVSVAEKKAKAENTLKKLKKKNPGISPIEIQGTKLANSWWGISWNKNLEGYADYSNRIGRGRSYVRHGAVLDLRIKEGEIVSLVQGSTSRPYTVKINIHKLKPTAWAAILQKCQGKIDSMGDLVAGKLPRAMETLLIDSKNGIFPSPYEIEFDCSCPDGASMCKHVAATLYGVGARLDTDPSLFFTLRGVKMEALVSQTLKNEANILLKRAKSKSSRRIIQNADLSSTFGIEMEGVGSPSLPQKNKKTKLRPGTDKPMISREANKNKEKPANKNPDYDLVVCMIRRRRVKGIGFKEIKKRTGIEDTKIRNILFRAKQKNEIKNISRGLYIKKN